MASRGDIIKPADQTTYKYFPDILFEDIPVTQVFVFCKNQGGEYCVVRDEGEKFFSLPGGGCEKGELPEDCLRRELQEEAQMTCKNIRLLGSILVEQKLGGDAIQNTQHIRYLAEVDKIGDFVPNKDGFETVERKFLPLDQLASEVLILQNPTAKEILRQVARA